MSDPLRDRLNRAGRDPRAPLDISSIARRARRLAWRNRAGAALGVVALLSGGYVTANELDFTRDKGPLGATSRPADCPPLGYDIAVFLKDEATDEQTSALIDEIGAIDDVESITFFSKSDAFEEFKELYQDQPEFWENLPQNALPASIRIRVSASADPHSIAVQLPHADAVDAITTVTHGEDAHPADGCPDVRHEDVWRPEGSTSAD